MVQFFSSCKISKENIKVILTKIFFLLLFKYTLSDEALYGTHKDLLVNFLSFSFIVECRKTEKKHACSQVKGFSKIVDL